MNELATRASRFPVGRWTQYDRGELRLSDGMVTFTSKHLGQLFQAPGGQVRAQYPWPYFGAGLTRRWGIGRGSPEAGRAAAR